MLSKNTINILLIFFVSVVLTIFSYAIFSLGIGLDLNNTFLYRGNNDVSSNKIIIIKVDNASLDALQKSDLRVLNLSKSIFARAIDQLQASWVKAVGVDIIFANLSEDAPELQKVLSKYENVVIGAKIGLKGVLGEDRVLPLPLFSGATWGAIDTKVEKNVINKIQPSYSLSGVNIESMSIALYRKYLSDKGVGSYQGNSYVINPLRMLPLDEDRNALIKFFHLPEGYPSYSLIDLLEWKIDKKHIEGKIALIGEYGTLIHDAHFSPLDPAVKMPGVEFHANMLDGLLQGKYLVSQPIHRIMSMVSITIFLLICVFYFLPTRLALSIFIGYNLFVFLFGRILFMQWGFVIDLFAYLLAGLSALLTTYVYKYFIVDKSRRFVEQAFSHYISPEVVKQIGSHPDSLRLWGQKREITIFFSDIVGFTTISETLGTEKIFALISEYLSEMTDILISNNGTLDKYIWDAVMGFFNAPLQIERSEYWACKTALEQQDRLRELNRKWASQGIPAIATRIGINTGEAMVGNIGSKERFNYTTIGDHVNLASRLEGVNKEYATHICVSESTFEKVRDDFFFRELDTIKVKGKTQGVRIYELVGFKRDKAIDVVRFETYEQALQLYYRGELSKAFKLFSLNSEDPASGILAKRCQDILDGTMQKSHDGIFEMTEK